MELASRWESLVWPRWLPERARLPVVAQITGAVAFTALLVGPWWSRLPETAAPVAAVAAVSLSPVSTSVPLSNLDAAHASNAALRPAHLNLDVRHNLGRVDLSVTVDGKAALQMKLDGSGKRFKMFGKRSERAYTRTLDLAPGVRVVRVRMRSNDGKFDQARTERFELGSATVAGIRISADQSGMSLVASNPPLTVAESKPTLPTARAPLPMSASPVPATAAPIAQTVGSKPSPVESAMVELVHSLRSMLIAIAGFVASAATGFVVQEFLRRRRDLLFDQAAGAPQAAVVSGERRRRRRAGKTSAAPDTKTPAPKR